jgi:hypothetical protein
MYGYGGSRCDTQRNAAERGDQMPHRGATGSGIGRSGLRYAIEKRTELQLVAVSQNTGLKQEQEDYRCSRYNFKKVLHKE